MAVLALVVCVPLYAARTFSNIDQRSDWQMCSACAGGGGSAQISFRQFVSSPSRDGASTQFNLGGSVPFSHALFWNRLGAADSSETNLTYGLYYLLKNPGASQGLEIAANQAFGGHRWKYSMQCSFGSGNWRMWDAGHQRWFVTGIACKRPAPSTWNHLVFEYKRSSGETVFISLTINGAKHYLNKAFPPEAFSDNGIGVRFQINGNSAQSDYSAWVDNMTLRAW
jgi:hypothetical protein